LRVALCGALAGATNAWLCYARLPEPVGGNPGFEWHLIPAGAVHGGLLAVAAFGLGRRMAKRSLALRLSAAPVLAWVAGVVSFIPLDLSAFGESWSRSLTWPFHEGWAGALVVPCMYFGLVAGAYYLSLALFCRSGGSLRVHVLCACAGGILGSLWWWISSEPWYFSLLHGAIWGALVGTGAWTVRRDDGSGMEARGA
jgi:hypothetical protein